MFKTTQLRIQYTAICSIQVLYIMSAHKMRCHYIIIHGLHHGP